MTVAELIERLRACDPEAIVGVMVGDDLVIPTAVCEDNGHVTIEVES